MKNLHRILSVLIFLCVISIVSINAQITSVYQITDVKETDKHFEALKNLVNNYEAFEPFPDATFRANQPLTRGEFAKQLERGLTQIFRYAERQGVKIQRFELNYPYSNNKVIIHSVKELKDLPVTNEYYEPVRTLIEKYGIDLSDEGYFRPDKAVTEKEFYNWIPVIFKLDFNGNPSPTKIVSRGEWIIGMSNAFNVAHLTMLELISKKDDKSNRDSESDKIEIAQNEQKSEPTANQKNAETAKPAQNPKDIKALLKEAENHEKAGDFSNALINYKEAGRISWNAPTEMKCGIEVYRITKKLIERDRNGGFVFEARKIGYKGHLEAAIDFLSSAILSDKNLVEAYQTRAAAYRLLKEVGVDKTKEAEVDERKVKELAGNSSQVPTKSKLEIIQSLPSRGKAKIVKKLNSYSPDNTCVDLSNASNDLKEALKNGGIWGDYRINNNQIGDIIFEAKSTCQSGEKIVLLRVGTAIVTITEKGIKRLK